LKQARNAVVFIYTEIKILLLLGDIPQFLPKNS